MDKSKLPEYIKKKQLLLAGAVIIGLVVISGGWLLLHDSIKSDGMPIDISKAKKIVIADLAKGVKAEDRWLEKAESEIKGLDKRLEVGEKEKVGIDQRLNDLFELNVKLADQIQSSKEENERLNQRIEDLQAQLLQHQANAASNISLQQPAGQEIVGKRIQNKVLDLVGGSSGKNVFKLSEYVPPGSYAKAMVISGADVSVGVNAQSNPIPAKLRIIGKAKTAAVNGKVQEVDLRGCVITAAASGDLSSERGYMRLLKMSCSSDEGVVKVSNVEGYVAGVGKAGIRGEVISREGDFVMKSFLAGIASGIGSGISQKMSTPFSFSSGIATQGRSDVKDILGSGVGKGIESSSNSLSDYLIKRAEQYQPVISLPAGMEVEVVFSEGVYLDGRGGKAS